MTFDALETIERNSKSNLNTETMKQDTEQEKIVEIKTNGNDNQYQKVVLNNVYWDENKTVKMEYWSNLSDNVRYICDTHEIQGKTREFHWFELYRSI